MARHIDNIIEAPGALILGAGIAGLFTALKLAPMPSIVLAGTRPGLSGSSAWAQGGIAAAIGKDDSWESHAADTLVAGAGHCDPAVVNLVTSPHYLWFLWTTLGWGIGLAVHAWVVFSVLSGDHERAVQAEMARLRGRGR